jgi:hypothetical protein
LKEDCVSTKNGYFRSFALGWLSRVCVISENKRLLLRRVEIGVPETVLHFFYASKVLLDRNKRILMKILLFEVKFK